MFQTFVNNYNIFSGEYLATLGDWVFYKVVVEGTMTSANVKLACDNAGLVTPCSGGDSSCQYNDEHCTITSQTDCSSPMKSVSTDICNASPSTCSQFDSVYAYMYNWNSGAACGVNQGSWCANGNNFDNKFAFCASRIGKLLTKFRK